MQHVKVKGHSVRKLESGKQTDGQTDGRTDGGDCTTSRANDWPVISPRVISRANWDCRSGNNDSNVPCARLLQPATDAAAAEAAREDVSARVARRVDSRMFRDFVRRARARARGG